MLERKNNRELHSWVQERLSAFMDNQLPPLERAQVDRHLRDCKECQRVLASLQWTVALLRQAPAPVLPRSFMLPVPKQAPRAPLIGLSVLRFATAMATLLLISLIGIDLILQSSSAGTTATSFAPRVAAVPPTSAPPTQAASHAANAATVQDGLRAATTAPMLKGEAVPTPAPTAAPPVVAPLPASPATAVPPTAAPRPTLPPAPTSAPAATTAPFAGALQSQTGATSRPSVRASIAQGSPTPTNLPGQGRGGGNEKSSQDNAAATAAPLESQPQSLSVGPTATPSSTATETPFSPPATATITPEPPAATAAPKRQALAQPTSIPATQPTVAPPSENIMPISPLRIAELGVLFVAVFLGVLTLLLRR
jgi:hypothetical protein